MMTTKLKSFLVILAMMAGMVNSVWAQTPNLTLDFSEWQQKSGASIVFSNESFSGITNGTYVSSITTTNDGSLNIDSRIAYRSDANRGWHLSDYNGAHGLRCWGPGYSPEIAISHCWNGDRIKIYFGGGSGSGIQFVNNSSCKVGGSFVSANQNLVSGQEITYTGSDILLKGVDNYTVITKIEFYYQNQYYTGGANSPSISFASDKPTELTAGGTGAMAYTNVQPTSAVPTFTSSNPGVATIDWYGYIDPISVGTTTITATLQVGNTTVSDSYTLTVKSAGMATYTCDFTGASQGAYELDTKNYQYAHNPTLKQLEFDGKEYGGNTFTFGDFFAVPSTVRTDCVWEGIFLTENGLYYHNDANHNVDLYVVSILDNQSNPVGVHNGDRITVYFGGGTISASSDNLNTTTLENGVKYIVTADGNLKLSIAGGVTISKIVIEHDWGTPKFEWSDADLATGFDTSDGGKKLRYDLSLLNFTEPLAVVVPGDASYTVTTSNNNVALISNTNNHDVMFVNTGTVDITGTMVTDQTNHTDTYTVEVWANNANYTEVGNTCTMSEVGMINADRKTVTSISGIRMEFGSPEDAALIVERNVNNTNYLVAYTINKVNGWRHKYPCNSAIPTHGSYYKFTALTNGKIYFKGVKDGNADNNVVLVDASNGNSSTEVFASGTTGYLTSNSAGIDLTAGHTYYLYGNVPADESLTTGWSAFLLSEFTFDSNFTLTNGAGAEVSYGSIAPITTSTTYPIDVVTINGVSGLSDGNVSVAGYSGDIQSATYGISDGKLVVRSITKKSGSESLGGAIRFRISDGGTGVKYYTLTVPYGTHTWDFRILAKDGNYEERKTALVTNLKTNAFSSTLGLSGLARTYKVVSKSNSGVWSSLIEPIIAVNGRVLGDNGFYFDKTAGLIFETRSSGLGARETQIGYYTVTEISSGVVSYYSKYSDIPAEVISDSEHYTVSSSSTPIIENIDGDNYSFDDESEYRLTYEVTRQADHLLMRGTSKIIFPGVTGGQYIKIYTYRHSDNKGETYVANNLVDLDGDPYTSSSFTYHGVLNGSSTGGIERCEGAVIFKVPTTYTNPNNDLSLMPSVTLSDDGWANIYKIEVCDEYSTDMKMSLNRGVYPEFIDVTPDCEYSSIVIKDGASVVQEYSGVAPQILVQNAGTVNFYFEPLNGLTTDNYEVEHFVDRTYNLVRVTYKGGHGVLKITQKEELGGYTVDKKDFYIAVNSLNSKTYPYTWDFTNHNMFQGSSSTETNLATPTGANFDGYGKWTNTNGTYGVNFKTNVAMEDATTTKPLFAHGSELCAGSNPIVEMAGLGVAGAYTTSEVSRSTGGNTYTYTYRTYTNTNNGISFDGNVLTFTEAGEITIPQVDNGMYVFVKSSVKPTTFTGLTELSENPFDVLEGVWLFQNQSEKQDCILTFSEGATIQTVAVTDITKGLDKFGCATESRDRAIDHTYEGELTNNDVNAYIITTADEYGTPYDYKGYPMVKKTRITTDIVPANVGVVLCKNNHNGDPFTSPLFVPAVNNVPAYDEINSSFWKSNWMIPNVVAKEHKSEETSKKDEMLAETSINVLPHYGYDDDNTPVWKMNESNTVIFGHVNSDPVRYVDLNGFKELRIYQTAVDGEGPVRCFFYNADGSAGVTIYPEFVDADIDYYKVDLKNIYNSYGQVKLICIKASAYNTTATVSDVKAVPYDSNPDATVCTKFIMSPNYFTYYKKDGSTSTQQNALVESFYRMRLYVGSEEDEADYNTLGANKALLLIPSENLPTALWNGGNGLARQGVIYMDLQDIEDAETTGVDAPVADATSDEQAVYYTLSGNRTNGKPTKKGIYVSNGKKVCVK